MNTKTRDVAVTESYPTFWDKLPEPPAAPPVAPDDAYSAFIDFAEDGLSRDVPRTNSAD
jgi:hypothetical protein